MLKKAFRNEDNDFDKSSYDPFQVLHAGGTIILDRINLFLTLSIYNSDILSKLAI